MRLSLRKKLLFSACTTLALCLVVFGGLEVALRISHDNIAQITGVNEWKTAEWGGITYHWDQYHEQFGWTNRPGFRSPPNAKIPVTINDLGLRDTREYAAAPPAGTKRILVFGDSFTFGDEVRDEQTIPALMAQLLPESEVLNFGVHGYGAGQMMMRLEAEGFQLQPSRVVVIYPTMDYTRDPAPELTHTKPVFGLNQGRLEISNVPVPEESRQPWLFRHSYAAARLFGPTVQAQWAFPLQENLRILERIMLRIVRSCEQRDVPLTLVHLPEPATVRGLLNEDTKTETRVRQIGDILKLATPDVLDLTDVLKSAYEQEGEALVAPGGHWSARANQLIAAKITAHIP